MNLKEIVEIKSTLCSHILEQMNEEYNMGLKVGGPPQKALDVMSTFHLMDQATRLGIVMEIMKEVYGDTE